MQKITFLLIISISILINCNKSNNIKINNLDTLNLKNNNIISSSKINGLNDSDISHEIYEIEGESIIVRNGPGKNYNKLINQKATDMIGETQYIKVDYTCRISVEEESNGWAKIKVVDPDYLSATHQGWIPLKYIVKNTHQANSVKLSELEYEIISISKNNNNNNSENYNIYLDVRNLSKKDLFSFIKQFREKNCSTCTISIFDTKSIKNLIDVYPLSKNEYLKFADHFVAWSTFDVPKLVNFYPFQDSQYKDYGGKNFKERKMR